MSVSIAFAGVAHSHPFSDASNLLERGAVVTDVWDVDDPERLGLFRSRFGARALRGLDELLDAGPDLVVATPRTPRAAAIARACAERGVPCFLNKTIAATSGHLDALRALPDGVRASSSVLRFSPAIAGLLERIGDARILAIDVIAQHDASAFRASPDGWQDDALVGGGTLVTVGVHAWEVVDVLLPRGRARVLSAACDRTASETVATVHALVGEAPVTATVMGVAGPDRYAVRVVTADGVETVELGDDAEALGYHGLADALLRMADGAPSPVAWDRTLGIQANAIEAAERARASCPPGVGDGRGGRP